MKRSFRQIFFVLALISITQISVAQKVSVEIAKEFASSWVQNKSNKALREVTLIDSLTYNNEATVYRFMVAPSGFIWVSADFKTAPVLAYSLDQKEPLGSDNPATDFLDLYHKEISLAKDGELQQTINHPGWSKSPASRLKTLQTDDVVDPMMEVTWGQGSGYNQFTPDNCPTGCVAVAMVQIMRHWEWPKVGKGQHSYTHDVYGEFSVDLDTISFDWANMPLNNASTDIAKAMLYTGYALHMNYAPDGSGAQTVRAGNLMESSFGFHENGRYIGMVDFGTTSNWIRVIKNELINEKPVIYAGHGTGGHAFNFDGFDGDYFHVNWGWSGSQNGYFLVSSLTPGTHNFSDGQSAVINLFPDSLLLWDRPYGIRVLASDSKVSLAWEGVYNGQLDHYNIYRDSELVGQANQRFFTDPTPSNGTSYNYSVSAIYSTDTADYESKKTAEVLVEPAAGFTVPYSEDFEGGHPGWLISDSEQGFQWGTAADLGMGSEDSNHVIGINSGAAGNKLVSDFMISNGLDFDGMDYVVVSFDYAFRKWQDVDHLYLMYRVFEDNEWKELDEISATKGYHDWANYKAYLPQSIMKENVQLALYYTDNGEIGYGALIDNIQVYSVEQPGMPDFAVSVDETCLNSEVIFTDNSSGTRDSYFWDFGAGANPKTAETAGPHLVTYNSSGPKSVHLVLNDIDEKTKTDVVTIVRPPSARFGKSINYKTVTFMNTSTNAEAYFWDFGDGTRVSLEDPVHTYALSGDYLVQLIAINTICGNDTTEQMISFNITGTEDILADKTVDLYPNPANNKLHITINEASTDESRIEIYNISGQVVINQAIAASAYQNTIDIDISKLQNGTYFVHLVRKESVARMKFLKID